MMNILKQHKRVVIVSLLLICLTVGISLALFNDKTDILKNTFRIGNVETDITEDKPITPESADSISKKPTIKNTGTTSALVRVRITLSPDDIVNKFNIRTDINTSNWIYNEKDGFYYYKYLLEPNSTIDVFEHVLGTDIAYKDSDKNWKINKELEGLEIAVYHESVQAVIVGNDGTQIIAEDGNINPDDFDSTNAGKIWSYFDSQE